MSADPNSYEDDETGHYVVNEHVIEGDADHFVNMLEQVQLVYGGFEKTGRPISGMVRRRDGAFSQLFEGGQLTLYTDGQSEFVGLDNLYAGPAA